MKRKEEGEKITLRNPFFHWKFFANVEGGGGLTFYFLPSSSFFLGREGMVFPSSFFLPLRGKKEKHFLHPTFYDFNFAEGGGERGKKDYSYTAATGVEKEGGRGCVVIFNPPANTKGGRTTFFRLAIVKGERSPFSQPSRLCKPLLFPLQRKEEAFFHFFVSLL